MAIITADDFRVDEVLPVIDEPYRHVVAIDHNRDAYLSAAEPGE